MEEEEIAMKPIIKVNPEVPDDENLLNVYLIPGVEGMFSSMKTLANKLKGNVYCIQYGYDYAQECIEDISAIVLKVRPFNLFCLTSQLTYSFLYL